jgi:F420H(2)-dependent biliverdin reductase
MGGTVSLKLSAAAEQFLAQDALCTFTTCRPDGSPHVTPVRFSWDPGSGLARVMTVASRRKVRNIVARPDGWVAVCQTVGYRWLTLEGTATVSDDAARIAEGVRRYARRYGQAPPNPPGLVVVEIRVDRVLGML